MERESQFMLSPEDLDGKDRTDFNRAMETLQKVSLKDMGFLNMVPQLEMIKDVVDDSTEEEKEKVRRVLKKMLLVLPPWKEDAIFIRQNLEQFAYSSEEQAEGMRLKEDSKERQIKIEQEIKEGLSPWWARVKHNEQNALNPIAVGFYQDPDGQIRTIFGPRYFQSKRQIKPENGRSEIKEVNMLSTRFRAVDGAEIMKSELFNLLPEDLRMRFEDGEILVTGDRDFYDISESEADNLASSKDVSAVVDHMNKKIANIGSEKQYHFLYNSDYRSEEAGRTGVLMVAESGKMEPLIITIKDKQFVLEIKGCGKKGGGFGKMHHRTGRDIVTGGAEKEQAINEFERLSENRQDDTPKAVASVLFNNQGYEQGYILRLSPSTVRASYSGSEVYPEINNPEQVGRIINIYAQELAEQIFASSPEILDRSSHTENILLWGDGRHTFTDFSDHVAFSDRHYPHQERHGGYMTPRQMLEYYVKMVEEIPGYQLQRDKKIFCEALQAKFQEKGISIELKESDDYIDISTEIWEKAMARQVFKSRRDNKYKAEGVLQELDKSVSDQYYWKDFMLESEDSFCRRLENGFKDIDKTLKLFEQKSVNTEIQHIDEINAAIKEKDLLKLSKYLNEVYEVYSENDSFNDTEGQKIDKAISYFSKFRNSFVNPIQRYLQHERDVIFSADKSATSEDREIIIKAKEEIKRKMQEFEKMLSNPKSLYRNLMNKNLVENLVIFDCYQKK